MQSSASSYALPIAGPGFYNIRAPDDRLGPPIFQTPMRSFCIVVQRGHEDLYEALRQAFHAHPGFYVAD